MRSETPRFGPWIDPQLQIPALQSTVLLLIAGDCTLGRNRRNQQKPCRPVVVPLPVPPLWAITFTFRSIRCSSIRSVTRQLNASLVIVVLCRGLADEDSELW